MGKKFRGNIGDRIKDVRGNMTQERFAKKLGVKQNYVCRYEKGRVPSPELLLKIAQIGNVTVDWLLTGRDNKVAQRRSGVSLMKGKKDLDRSIQKLLNQMTPSKKKNFLKILQNTAKTKK